MGLIYGEYGGRSDSFLPGAISFETSFTPHGVAYPEFCAASETARPVEQISLGTIMFMVESSKPFAICDHAWNSPKIHFHEPSMWDDLRSNFDKHLDEIKKLTNGNWEHGVNVPKTRNED
jgi:homogentisate 1,2-dioxygenase